MEVTPAKTTARASSGCLCIAFVFALLAVISPYWLWRYSWSFGFGGSSVTTASGSFVASALQGRTRCGWYTDCVLTSQWNYFDDFNNTLCTGDFYDRIGRFGFCSEAGSLSDLNFMGKAGVVQTPPRIVEIQALTVTATVLVFFAMCGSCAAPEVGRKGATAALITGIICFAAFCTSTAAWGLAVSYDYYQQFSGSGWFLPFISTENCPSGRCLGLSPQSWMGWGPAFGGMVFVSICTLLSTCTLCGAYKGLKSEADDYEAYDGFNREFDAGGPIGGSEPEQQTVLS